MTKFNVGDRVVHLAQFVPKSGEPFASPSPYPNLVGKTATVVKVERGVDEVLDVRWDEQPTNDNGLNWGGGWFEVVEEGDDDAVLTRPLVHFSDEKAGRNRELARSYAREAVSKVLKPEHNLLFKQAAAGHSVDAYALNEAVTAAMRSSVTRKGQSTARRQQASHFAHLGHMVQAVLENHADNLPAYQSGERSRVVEDAKAAVTTAKAEVDRVVARIEEVQQERTTLTQAASDERRRLCEEINSHLALIAELRSVLADTRADVERTKVIGDNTVDYAKKFLTDDQAARVDGFSDGVAAEYDYRTQG